MSSESLKEKFPQIYEVFQSKGCSLTYYEKKTVKLKYICKCGLEKEKMYSDFIKNKTCRSCTTKKIKEKPESEEIVDELTGEIWKPISGGWISNFGNCKSFLGKFLTLCPTKFRFHVNGKHQYASRLVAEAFQIENHEKLNDPIYIVSHKDGDSSNNHINNLFVTTKAILGTFNGSKSRSSETFTEKFDWKNNKFDNIAKKIIPELPKHTIYSNGEIWNGNRFLTFSKTEKYLNLCCETKTFKVHRLICYAFNPIQGKKTLEEYEDLQVNHKDGNTYNNNFENLEWVSKSQNIQHSYDTNLNNKVRNVLQFDKLSGKFLNEYNSIAEACRKTGELEHRIRDTAKGKINSYANYLWKFKNEEETEEFSKKYSSR